MADSASNLITPLLTSLLMVGGLATVAYVGTCFALYSYQRKLIFRPFPGIIRTPADIGLPYEDVWIPVSASSSDGYTETSYGQKLHGWWLPNPGHSQTLLFCHGNYGNISYNLERIRFYYSLGFSIFAFDYRGYGQSSSGPSDTDNAGLPSYQITEPVPTEKSTYTDAEMAWQYLIKDRKIRPENLTVMGHSMGGAIAINLATEHPDIAQLIVASSFTTMQDAVHAKKIYRLFPIEQLLTEPFDSLSKVKKLKMPVLYVHGDQDLDIPTEMSQRLYEASPQPKHIWFAPGAGHNDIPAVAGDTYKEALHAFLNSDQISTMSSAA
jgi:uncharacterized protein